MDLGYGTAFDFLGRAVVAIGALLGAYIEPNPAVWLAATGAAFLCTGAGKDRTALGIVRRIAGSTACGIALSQIVAYMTHIPAPPLAFAFAWIGPDVLNGLAASWRNGEWTPGTILASVLDHILGRGSKHP